jgi:T-complex protein 1 subunit eta
MIVRRCVKANCVVAGGGAIEMELSRHLREHSRTISGKLQHAINSYARALEVIPKTLAENAGFDSVEILNRLRQKHTTDPEGKWFGVDVAAGSIADNFQSFVWEPSLVKINAITAATEAACTILSIDETVKNEQNEPDKMTQEMAAKNRAARRK